MKACPETLKDVEEVLAELLPQTTHEGRTMLALCRQVLQEHTEDPTRIKDLEWEIHNLKGDLERAESDLDRSEYDLDEANETLDNLVAVVESAFLTVGETLQKEDPHTYKDLKIFLDTGRLTHAVRRSARNKTSIPAQVTSHTHE